jgi:Cof subfamily protein (haloacid dehalogenase superfamily)
MAALITTPHFSEYSLPSGIKLAFFDIDGTLLSLDGNYSSRLKEAMQQAKSAGMKLAVASGRPKFSADFLINELGLDGAGLFYTGALVMDPVSGESIAEHTLSDELVSRLVSRAQELSLYTEVCGRDQYFIAAHHPINNQHSHHLRSKPEISDLSEIVGRQPILKLLFAVENLQDHVLLTQLEAEFPETVFAYARMPGNPDWLFVSVIAQRACKRVGFEKLLRYHGVQAHEVAAFGDAQSDKEFLSMAGLGVAMGNAHDDVKAVADVVTLPVWDDGVAAVLEGLL